MAKTYRPVDRDQVFLLPPSMGDWLPEDHVVWFVIAAVRRLQTARFHARARLGGVGRRGYDPDMMLTLWVYAMAHGESSSRQIERLCQSDVAFRIICAGDVPDHTVLARFRRDHQQALCELLTESLVLAAELGMVCLGVVAVDGTKIAASASKEANRTEAHLRRVAEEYLADAEATDDAEDARFGEDVRGDEMPEPVRDPTRRGERIAQALDQIRQRRDAAEQAERRHQKAGRDYERAQQAAASPGGSDGPSGPAPATADAVVVAKARYDRAYRKAQDRYRRWQQRRDDQTRPAGRPPKPPQDNAAVRKAQAAWQAAEAATGGKDETAGSTPSPTDRIVANTTDPDSRLQKTRNGWIQGYNCQTTVSADAFILAARATPETNDTGQFQPTVADVTDTVTTLGERTGRDDLTLGTMLADAGYDTNDNLTAEGPNRLIADANRRRIDRRADVEPATGDPPEDASPRQQMNHRLRTAEGHALYKRRGPIVETPNAWLKDRRGLRQFSQRGLTAVQAELSLAATVTNLLKLATHGITAAQLHSP